MKFLTRLSCMLLIFSCQLHAESTDTSRAAGLSYTASSDSEQFNMQRKGLIFSPAYTIHDAMIGIRYESLYFNQAGWSREGQQIGAKFREIDPLTAAGWNLEASLTRQGPHDLLALNTGYRSILPSGTGMDLFLERDWVETRASLENGVHHIFGGIAFDHPFNPNLTLVALAGSQGFSDGNSRTHGRLRMIFQPDTDLGLTLQLRYRTFVSVNANTTTYFNPEKYDELLLAIAWKQRILNWIGSLTMGVGDQTVANTPATPTSLFEFALQSPAYDNNSSLRIRAVSSQSASYGGADYQYRSLQAEWLLAF